MYSRMSFNLLRFLFGLRYILYIFVIFLTLDRHQAMLLSNQKKKKNLKEIQFFVIEVGTPASGI